MDTPAERLRAARIAAGYENGSDAARAFGWTPATYLGHENGSRGVRADSAARYGRAFNVPPEWILFGKGSPGRAEPRPPKPIYLRGYVQAGLWQPNWEWEGEADTWQEVVIPRPDRLRGIDLFALEVRGESMNRVFPPGTILICAGILDLPDRKSGDPVIVRRWNDSGDIEMTCKELRLEDDGSAWLWPRSTRPEFQQPIQITAPPPPVAETFRQGFVTSIDFDEEPASTLASPGQVEIVAGVVSHLAWD